MSNFPTLDGLINISGDSADLNDIICETFIATISAQAPTMPPGNISNNIATTAFVDDAISTATSTLVTTNTTQTLTSGTKYFTNNPQSLTSAAPTLNNEYTNKKYVDDQISGAGGSFVTLSGTQTLTTGVKTFTYLPESSATPTTANQLVPKNYVDNNFLALTGTQTVTGNKTFDASTTTIRGTLLDVFPTTTQLYSATTNISGTTLFTNSTTQTFQGTTTNITTPATNLSGTTTTISGTNCNISSPATNLSGTTTTISGTNCNITSPATNLSGTTTTISGTNCNITSPSTNLSGTTTTIAGTTTYLNSPTVVVNNTVNSFYVDASYSNFVGDETLLQSPYTTISSLCTLCEVNPVTLRLQSPTIDVQSSCGNFNIIATNTTFTGTNTNLTGTNATATTQATADNSTKLATTAYVNAYGNANYMTIGTNQSVSGVKTYSTKQIFNAGTASSTYDNTSLTDMTLAGNSGTGILDIAGGRIQTDTFGVSIAETLNLQLNEGTFIQPITSLSPIDEPVFTFGLNQSTGYVDIPAVPRSAEATKKINTGVFSWFSGNNQSTTFTITHSIDTSSLAGVGTMYEAEVYFYFQDMNTGITRYTTGNLATTTGFTLLPLSTNIRPTITFSLTTATLPQGAYSIYGYSRVTDAYSLNAGNLSVNWNLASPVSGIVTTQDYNTRKDYTFTSRNVYHCFRNYVAGVYHVNVIGGQQNIITPLFYSVTYYTNIFTQASTSGALTTPAQTGGTVVGNWSALSVNNSDNLYIVYPNYSIIVYNTNGWAGTIYLNFKNTTNNPVVVAPTTISAGSSCKIYFDEVELLPY